MRLFSWTVPSETPGNICVLSQVNADGNIIIGDKEYPLGHWPSEGTLTVKINSEDDMSADSQYFYSDYNIDLYQLHLEEVMAYVFTGKKEVPFSAYCLIRPVINSSPQKWIVSKSGPVQVKKYQNS